MFSFLKSIFSNGDSITNSEAMIDTSPAVNIDGTPMCGDMDIHGNPFGVTSSDDDTFSCDSSMSMFDDSPGCGCDSSMFDD